MIDHTDLVPSGFDSHAAWWLSVYQLRPVTGRSALAAEILLRIVSVEGPNPMAKLMEGAIMGAVDGRPDAVDLMCDVLESYTTYGLLLDRLRLQKT